MRQSVAPRTLFGRVAAFVLMFSLLLGIIPTGSTAASVQDSIDKLVDWGVMRGDIDGNLNADNAITRAEFVTMINRAFGFSRTGATPFKDVLNTAWYAEDVGIAYTEGYIAGTSANTFSPSNNVTREQAAVILSRILALQPLAGENTDFTDSREIANWSRGLISAAVDHKLLSGYPDGSFRPQRALTRGEAAILLVNAIGTPIQSSGAISLGDTWGNVTITESGTTLQNTVVGGNLYISGGVELGNVTLENVTVLGEIVICGGGVSEGGDDSFVLRNVTASKLVLDNISNQQVSLRVDGDGVIDETCVRTNAFIVDNTLLGAGLSKIAIDSGETDLTLTVSGNVKEVITTSPESTVNLAGGQAQVVTIDEKATDSALNIVPGARVDTVNLDTATLVTGGGDIGQLNVNGAGSMVTILPDQITIRPGITATIAGELMDSASAAESSADPRLYAGYPSISNLAPTSADANFSANKRGTVYWAVTASTDGSVSAEDLINPSSYSPKTIKSGTVSISGAGKVETARISGLTTDGSYYLSTVFVDARDMRSPLKVISFSTPDNTKPNFASGYPYLSKITSNSAQVTVMTTKTCRLYYAVLPKGASAPTANDFKANAITGNLGFGTMDMTKNSPVSFQVNSVPLEELEDYDLYLWLTDVDGAQSSSVKKLSFTTVDGTPPVFNTNPTINSVKETSVGLYANLNEAGTLYWVIVNAGEVYPKPVLGQGEVDLSSETAKLQVMAGMNALKSGKVNMTANKDVNFTVSGLDRESSYDLYYVAQDKAGLYSATVGKITIHTLDANAPTVEQEFSKYNGTDTDTPLPESDVRLVFSELVQVTDGYVPLTTLYQKVTEAINQGSEAEMAARNEMSIALSRAIHLYQVPSGSQPVLIEGRTGTEDPGEDWTIDYRYARITAEEGKTVITFPNGEGINLKSGATYYFEIQAAAIADTSSAANNMGLTQLDRFTTVFAIVNLSPLNENTITIAPPAAGSETPSTASAHLSWRLNPVSTDKVDDSIDWDMIMWSDTSVEFDLYSRQVGDSGSDIWSLLGRGNIDVPDSSDGFLGISLTREFIQVGSNNPDFSALNTLDPDTAYEYAIVFTRVAGLSDADAWSQRINMQINIVAGSNNDLSTLSANVTEETWQESLDEGLTSIGQPETLALRHQFTDQKAPVFTGDYPTFNAGDSAVEMSLRLDRPGTIYYVIAPLGYVGTTGENGLVYDDNAQGQNNWEATLPSSGKDDDIDNTQNPVPPILSEPDYLSIVNASSNYRGDKIKYGSVVCGSSVEEELVDGLEPETRYIAYFVLQGTAQTYSRVLAYRFMTTAVSRPVITMEADPPSVHFQTDITADLTYALVANNQIPQSWREENGFVKVVDTDPQIAERWQKYVDTLGTTNRSIIWALCTTYGASGYSVFDEFANASIRSTVYNFISGNSGQGSNVATRGGKTLTQSNNYTDSQNFTSNMTGDTIYYCIAMAYSPLGSETSFAAVNGVYLPDLTPPEFVSVSTTITGSTGIAYPTYSGRVTFTFDEPVYQLVRNASGTEQTAMAVLQTTDTLDDAQKLTAVRLIDVIATTIPKDKLGYVNKVTKASNTLTLTFEGISVGDIITFFSDSSISDQFSNSMGSLTFKLEETQIGNISGSQKVQFVLQE